MVCSNSFAQPLCHIFLYCLQNIRPRVDSCDAPDARWLFRKSRKGTRAWALELSGRPKNSFRIINCDLSPDPPYIILLLGTKIVARTWWREFPNWGPRLGPTTYDSACTNVKVADTKFGQILSISLSLSLRSCHPALHFLFWVAARPLPLSAARSRMNFIIRKT